MSSSQDQQPAKNGPGLGLGYHDDAPIFDLAEALQRRRERGLPERHPPLSAAQLQRAPMPVRVRIARSRQEKKEAEEQEEAQRRAHHEASSQASTGHYAAQEDRKPSGQDAEGPEPPSRKMPRIIVKHEGEETVLGSARSAAEEPSGETEKSDPN